MSYDSISTGDASHADASSDDDGSDGFSPGRFTGSRPEEILEWALGRWRQQAAIFTAFQAEGMVLLDMARKIDPAVRVVTIDTGRLPEETFELIEKVRDRYGVAVEIVTPDAAEVAAMVDRHGPNLFRRSPEDRLTCCRVRKVEPLRRALSGLAAWITGQRRGQSASRAAIGRLEVDSEHGGLYKLNPLAAWGWQQVWDYIRAHDVPYHGLYDQGYTSIGCAPCTRAVRPWEDHRAGRWWWEDEASRKECGLHWSPSGTLAAPGRSLPVLDDAAPRELVVTP